MTTPVSFDNRFFSATWSAIARREPQEIKELRAENLRGLTGHVLEVGAGIGSNFLLYPNTVTAVTALEPESRLRPQAEDAAAGAAIPVTVTAGVFEDLAVTGEDRFDAVVCSLVLCSVGDPDRTAAQAFEVLKPGERCVSSNMWLTTARSGWFSARSMRRSGPDCSGTATRTGTRWPRSSGPDSRSRNGATIG